MVRPPEEKSIIGKSLEDRLAEKFDALQISRENKQAFLFDEICKSIEVLLIAVPGAYNQLMSEKKKLNHDKEKIDADIEYRAVNAEDKIKQNYIRSTEGFQAEWEYRETYEEILMEIMTVWSLITIESVDYAELIPDIPEPPEPIQQPKPVTEEPRKKPKLSINK